MSWVSWIVGGVAAAGGMAAKEIISNAGKEIEADKEEPAPKKSRKKKT